jgi:hypothetical protein
MVHFRPRLLVSSRSSVMMQRLVVACLLGLCCMTVSVAYADTTIKAEEKAADDPNAIISTLPPAGFEEMAAPEQTQIDVFYGGVKIGSYPATYDLKNVTFEKPEEIVANIPHLRDIHKAAVLETLKKPLDKNLAAHCPKEVIDQKIICGSIVPETAGLIFYEDTFKADIFVNPTFLDLQDTRLGITLPKAEKVFSGVHTFNGTVTGTDLDTSNFSMLQGSILSYGQARVNFSNVITPDQTYVNTAAIGLDRGGLLSRVGLFDTGHFQTIPQVRLGGVSIETSFDTNLDLKRTAGNLLTIYLPKRSWVTLLRGKTIYSSDFYEAGNQIIDTSQLPDGAYELTLQINEGSGPAREERRFYAKNFNIPPTNVPVYYMQAGMLRNETELSTVPKLSDQHVFIAGTTRRLTKNTGANIGIMNTSDNNFLETSLFSIFPQNNQVSVGGLASPKGDYGASASYIGSAFKDRLGFAASVRKIWAAPDEDAATAPLTPSLAPLSSEPVAFEPQDAWQASSTVSYQLHDNISLNFQYNETSTAGSPKTSSYGPYLRWNLWQKDEKSVMLFADATHATGADNASAYLRFSYSFGKWGLNTDGGSRWSKDNTAADPAAASTKNTQGDYNPYANTRLTWSDTDTPGRVINAGVEFNKDKLTESKRADLDYRSQTGRLKLDLAQNTISNTETVLGTGSFGFNILHGGAHIAAGGDREERSGFIIRSKDTEKKNRKRKKDDKIAAKVFVNGSDVGIVQPGQNLPVLLSPYETYKVTAQPVNSDKPVEVTTTTKDITLYPGNVIPVSLNIQRIYIMLGRLVDENGNPVANARLKNARGLVVTDEDGNFQAEVTDPESLVFSYTKSHFLRSELYGPFEPYGPPTPGSGRMFDPIIDNQPVEVQNLDGAVADNSAPEAMGPFRPAPVADKPVETVPTTVVTAPPATLVADPAPVAAVAAANPASAGFTLQDIKENLQSDHTEPVVGKPADPAVPVQAPPSQPMPTLSPASEAIPATAEPAVALQYGPFLPAEKTNETPQDSKDTPGAIPDDSEEETDTHQPGDPTMIVPENTPQWVRDAAKLDGQASLPAKKIICSARLPHYRDKNGVIILKDALVCAKEKSDKP